MSFGVQDARPEAGDLAHAIPDGEHDPVAEFIVIAARIAFHDQPCLQEFIRGVPLGCEMLQGSFPARRRIAQSKSFQRGRLDPPFEQVIQSRFAGGGLGEGMAVKCRRLFQQGAQPGVFFLLGKFFGSGGFKAHARFFSQELERGGEIPAFFFHHELEDIPALVARAKAAPRPRVRKNGERRGARIGVKGAEPAVVLAGLAQLHRLRHQLDDIDAGLDLFNSRHGRFNFISISRLHIDWV